MWVDNFFLEFHAFQNKFLSETFFISIDGENTPKWRCHKNPVKVDTSKIEIYFVKLFIFHRHDIQYTKMNYHVLL